MRLHINVRRHKDAVKVNPYHSRMNISVSRELKYQSQFNIK